MSRRPARVTQADIARAIRAAEQAATPRKIVIAPDGSIEILPISPIPPQEQGAIEVPPKKEIVL